MNVDLTVPWDLADIVFIIEDKKLYVNKPILMMSSDVFRTMFTADFREKELAEIPLPGKNFDTFLQLMKVIHPPHMEVNGTNVRQLLPLSHEYAVHHVTSSCEKVLLTEPSSVQNLVLADRYSLLQLREACVQYAQQTPLTQLEAQPGFDELQPDTMIEVLRFKVLQTELQQEPGAEVEEGGAELTKEFLCELMSKPPSVQNLVLAEKYDIPQLKETCIQYAKNKPMYALKAEFGYDKITLATLVEILKRKVIEMEPKVRKFDNLEPELRTLSSTLDSSKGMSKDGVSDTGICCLSIEKNNQHKLGCYGGKDMTSECIECRRFTVTTIANTQIQALKRLYDSYRK